MLANATARSTARSNCASAKRCSTPTDRNQGAFSRWRWRNPRHCALLPTAWAPLAGRHVYRKSNVFAADTLDPNGASFLTVHLFRNYGRPTQREEVVDAELTREAAGRGNDNERMIGRIVMPKR